MTHQVANLSWRSSDDRKLDNEDGRDGFEAEGRQPLVRHRNADREIAQRRSRTLALLAGDDLIGIVNFFIPITENYINDNE